MAITGYACPATVTSSPANKARKDRGIIAKPDADMDDMLARFGCRAGNQPGMQRRLTVVEVALRQDRDHYVVVEVDRVAVRRH